MNKDNNAFHSRWKEKLHETILEIAKRAPRFLFRVWHEISGGQKGLNASHAITPLAFRKGENPSTIHDVGAIELGDCIDNRFLGVSEGAFETYFSSWTQSFSTALSMCADKAARTPEVNVYLSIIDTGNLPKENVAFFTRAKEFSELNLLGSEWEFMVFGVVSGDAHVAVPWQTLAPMLPPLEQIDNKAGASPLSDPNADDVSENVSAALKFGEAFGQHFAMAIVAHFLCMRRCSTDASKEMRDKLLAAFALPSDWAEDPAIMDLTHAYSGGILQVQLTFAFLGDLVRQKYEAYRE